MLRFGPVLAIALLTGPIFCGLIAVVLPAFGYLPAIGGHEFSLQPFADLFARPGLLRSCLISLGSGLITTAISLSVVALFIAGWSGTRTFTRLQHVISPLLSVPHAAAAFGLAFLIAPSGWLVRLVSPELTGITRPPDVLIPNDPYGLSLTLGLVVKEIPFLMLVALAALPQVQPRRSTYVASSLGYGKTAGFLFAVWPRIYRQIRLAVYAVISYASSVVDVAIILGPERPSSLAVRLVGWMDDPDLALRFEASAGALLQLGVTLATLVIWFGLERLAGWIMRTQVIAGRRFSKDAPVRALGLGLSSLAAFSVFAGLFILALWSVAGFWAFPDALPQALALKSWQRSLPSIGGPFQTTIVIGVVATLLAVAITLICLERESRIGRDGGSRALLLVYIPLIVPQASFLFGLQFFFLTIGLDASYVGLVLVHLIFVLPYVFLSLSDPWRAFDPRYANLARSLGSSENRIFWRIRLPILLRAILAAAAVGFAVSIGQYLPTILIGAGRLPTITTEAVALASGGDRRVIGVYAFVQMVLPFLGFLIAVIVPAILFRNRRNLWASS
ncbi:MAG: ABC transporter permease subunit [Pseudomonadota bacterium]